MKIYIGKNGEQQGPYSIEEINALAQSATITENDTCWYKGCAEWIPLSNLPGFTSAAIHSPVAVTQSADDALYYLVLNNEQAGPYTVGQLRAMWQNGKTNARTQYCAAGGTSWQPLITFRAVVESPAEKTAPASNPRGSGISAPALQPLPQGKQLNFANAEKPPFRSDVIGYIMLAIPAITALLVWQSVNFGLPVIALGIIAVITTAVLAGVEAKQIGMGSDADKTPDGKRNSGPV